MTETTSQERSVQRAEKKQPTAHIAMTERGVQLRKIEDAFRFAESVIQAGLAPKGLNKPQQVMLMIQAGAELGITPMRSLSEMACINNRVGPMTRLAKALIRQSGVMDRSVAWEEWIEVDGERKVPTAEDYAKREVIAYCRSKRSDEPQPVTHSFSVQQAKTAKLWGKTGQSGQPTPWVLYPDRMLLARARGFHIDDQYADVIMGMTIAEVLADLPPAQDREVQAEIERQVPPDEPDPLLMDVEYEEVPSESEAPEKEPPAPTSDDPGVTAGPEPDESAPPETAADSVPSEAQQPDRGEEAPSEEPGPQSTGELSPSVKALAQVARERAERLQRPELTLPILLWALEKYDLAPEQEVPEKLQGKVRAAIANARGSDVEPEEES